MCWSFLWIVWCSKGEKLRKTLVWFSSSGASGARWGAEAVNRWYRWLLIFFPSLSKLHLTLQRSDVASGNPHQPWPWKRLAGRNRENRTKVDVELQVCCFQMCRNWFKIVFGQFFFLSRSKCLNAKCGSWFSLIFYTWVFPGIHAGENHVHPCSARECVNVRCRQ